MTCRGALSLVGPRTCQCGEVGQRPGSDPPNVETVTGVARSAATSVPLVSPVHMGPLGCGRPPRRFAQRLGGSPSFAVVPRGDGMPAQVSGGAARYLRERRTGPSDRRAASEPDLSYPATSPAARSTSCARAGCLIAHGARGRSHLDEEWRSTGTGCPRRREGPTSVRWSTPGGEVVGHRADPSVTDVSVLTISNSSASRKSLRTAGASKPPAPMSPPLARTGGRVGRMPELTG
jgi:hypothetical protein